MMNTGCSSGRYCFKKSDLNYQAIIDPNTFLHFQLKTCNFMDSNPAFGLCILLRLKFEGIIITRSFSEATGSVVPEIDIKKISLDSFRSTIMDGN